MATAILESYLPNDIVERISHDTHKMCMVEVFDELSGTINNANYIYGKVDKTFPNIPLIDRSVLDYVHSLMGEGRFIVYRREGTFVTVQELSSNRWLIKYNHPVFQPGFLMEVSFYPSSKKGELEVSIQRGLVWLIPNDKIVSILKSIIKNVLGVKESFSVEIPSKIKNFQSYDCIVKIVKIMLMVELFSAAPETPNYIHRSAYTDIL